MTKEEKIQSVLNNEIIYKKIINKAKIDYRFKEDLLQHFYEKILMAKSLPNTPVEILKYSKVMLANLIIDSRKHRHYKFVVDKVEYISLDEHEEDFEDECLDDSVLNTRSIRVETELNAKQINECESYQDYEDYFVSVLDDCLKDSFYSFEEQERNIIVRHLLVGYTAKELGKEYDILIQSVKNIILRFRQNCNIQINIDNKLDN